MSTQDDLDFNIIEAERNVLSILMHSAAAAEEIFSKLTHDDFEVPSHQVIFKAISEIYSKTISINITQIVDYLSEQKELTKAGGVINISTISGYFISDEGLEGYIEILFKKSIGRKLDAASRKIVERRNNNLPVLEILEKTQSEIINIRASLNDAEISHVRQIVDELFKKIHLLEQSDDGLTGIPTGFVKLDWITNGWQKSDFIILAARPSMGKTAFALNLAWNASAQGRAIAIFSLEMPKEQLVERILSSVSRVNSNLIRTGKGIDEAAWRNLEVAKNEINKTNIIIDDSSGLNVLQIQSKLRKMKRDYNVDVCIIDYLQLISSISEISSESRQNEIATISRQLKKLAREMNIPIICLSQLSRSVEKREDKRPIMSDLRDSGAIEQDADLVMFLYREDYYKLKQPTTNLEYAEVEETDLIISKHRNGQTGIVNLNFHKKYGKFTDKQ